MVYQVVVGRVAERDLIAIGRYIACENPAAAEKLIAKLLQETKSLTSFPNRGARYKERPDARFTLVGSYLVIYRVAEKEKEVRILRFWHTARERLRFEKS